MRCSRQPLPVALLTGMSSDEMLDSRPWMSWVSLKVLSIKGLRKGFCEARFEEILNLEKL